MKENKGFVVTIVVLLVVILTAIYFIFKEQINKAVKGGIKILTDFFLKPEQEIFISKLHPVAQQKFRDFITRIEKETGYSVIVTSGYRTFSEQQKLYDINHANAKPGYGFHNYGMAIDINATNGTTILKKATDKKTWESSGIPKIGKEMNFRWGGDFISQYDPVHFDLGNNYDTTILRGLAVAQFGTDNNKIEGNKVKIN